MPALLERLGSGRTYTVGELFQEAGVRLTKPNAKALSASAALFVRSITASTPLALLEAAHVCARESAPDALASDVVLLGVLRRLALTGKARAHSLAALEIAVGSRYGPAFRAVLQARVAERRWPSGVGAVPGLRGAILVLLLDDLVSGAPPPPSFARAFDAAFSRLRDPRGLNLVSLSALRAALPQFPRDAFDRELGALRAANHVVLHTFDGRHGRLAADEAAAAIEEGGRRFVYAARRELDD